jgi:hypothetical protein
VPGLFQTPDYARAVIQLSHLHESAEEIERHVALRMARQKVLTQPEARSLWAVLDEATLRRPLGSREVMHAQLRYLIEITELPNITLQVVPFSLGGYTATGGPFTVLRFTEPDLPDIVYLEQLTTALYTTALYLDKKTETNNYLLAMDNLVVQAESAANTRRFLNGILKDG